MQNLTITGETNLQDYPAKMEWNFFQRTNFILCFKMALKLINLFVINRSHHWKKGQEYSNAHIWRERWREEKEERERDREKSGTLQKKIVGREWNIEIHTFSLNFTSSGLIKIWGIYINTFIQTISQISSARGNFNMLSRDMERHMMSTSNLCI